MKARNLRGKRATVIGAARSGVAAACLLKREQANVFVSDRGTPNNVERFIQQLDAESIPYELGGHTNRVYDSDLMVVSPGVPSNAPVVVEAQRRSIEIISELELAFLFCKARVVAVTGSNGKTTTTTLIGRMLADAKLPHAVAGNIGTPFSSVVGKLDESSVAVLEVSSFQLDHCKEFRPDAAVLLNITADHLDRYENSMEKYAASKARIFMNQTASDSVIFNEDDRWVQQVTANARSRKFRFSQTHTVAEGAYVESGQLTVMMNGRSQAIVPVREISLPGEHNLYNAMAATLAALHVGVSTSSIRATLRNFKGVEHRLEDVAEIDGVRYVNDSKATNVDSTWYALRAYSRPIILLLGGRDKGNDYSKLVQIVRERVKALVAIGESAEKVAGAFKDVVRVETVQSQGTSIPNRPSMEAAVRKARSLAAPGDIVLLSPACASFDWFHDYEERGEVYKDIVRSLQ